MLPFYCKWIEGKVIPGRVIDPGYRDTISIRNNNKETHYGLDKLL